MSAPALAALERGATVVTATRRLARYLRWRHDGARLAAGAAAWTGADALPWEAWVARLWERELLEGAPALLSGAELRLLWRQVLEGEGRLPAEARLLGTHAARSWRLCEHWGITETRLAAAADTEEARAFAGWVRAFRRRCRELGRTDLGLAADRLIAAACDESAEVTFAGFDPWTPLHERVLAAVQAAGRAACRLPAHGVPGRLHRLACEDPADELRRASAWARALLDRDPALRVGLVLPDLEARGAALRRAGLDALVPGWASDAPSDASPPQGPPLSVSLGRPLSRYPIVHTALLLIATAAPEIDWRVASQLLRSPLIAGERPGRLRADLALRQSIGATVGTDHLRALCRRHAPGLGERLDRLRDALLASGTALPSRWARRVDQALSAAGWPGEPPPIGEAGQAAAAWQRLLQAFSARDDLLGPLDGEAARRALVEMAAEQPFEPAGHDAGLQVMGLLEAEGQQFDALWICGLTADEWPPPARPDPFLPLALQRELGLPEASADSARRQAERRFARLLAAAPEVVGSWPLRRGEEEALPSPWIAGAGELPPPPSSRPWRDAIAASAVPELAAADPPPPLAAGSGAAGGAGLLNAQARCPARAFVEYRLRARELPVPRPPLDARGRGKLVHRFLERLYARPECRANLGRLDETQVRDAVGAVLDDLLREALPGSIAARRTLRALEHARLSTLADRLADLDRARGEFLVDVERPWTATIGPLSLALRPDRLECHGETLLVLDYKTGRFSPGGWRSTRLGECQLPLYAQAPGVGGIGVARLTPDKVQLEGVVEDEALAASGLREPGRFMREPGLRWNELVARWRRQLEALAHEYAAGDFRVNPRERELYAGPWAPVIRAADGLPGPDEE